MCSRVENVGWSLQAGGGYDLRLARRFALVPFANVVPVIMDANGSNLVELLRSQWRHIEPSWSPDGTKISFLSNRHSLSIWGGPDRIYLMDVDGSNIVGLPAPEHVNRDVFTYAWSPDGSRIAFGYTMAARYGSQLGSLADCKGWREAEEIAQIADALPDDPLQKLKVEEQKK